MLVSENDSEELMRLVAVIAIVVAALSLVIPLLHRIGRMESSGGDLLMPVDQRNVAAIDSELVSLRKQIAKLEKLRAEIVDEQAKSSAENHGSES